MNRKYIVEITFLISVNYLFNVIKDSHCEHITVGVNIYLYWCVSLLASECECLCLCVCVCVISNQSASKKLHHVSDLTKLDTLLHRTHIKVLRIDMCRSIILSKIEHQIWCDYPFSQRNKAAESALGLVAGGERNKRLNLWKGGRQYRGVVIK